VLRHRLSFAVFPSRGGEIKVRQNLLAPCEALAQLLRETSRVLEGGEVVALL
jgi:hypothetical protein